MTDRTTGNRGIILLTACAVSATLALIAMGATLVYRTTLSNELKVQTARQCQALESVKSAIRLVFTDQLAALERRKATVDPSAYRIAHDYYQRQLDRFKPTTC